MGRLAIAAGAVLMGVVAGIPPEHVAVANGAHRLVFSGDAGPYGLNVRAAPAVGNLHLRVYLFHPGTQDPARDVEVEVSAEGPGRERAGPAKAGGSVAGVGWYSATLEPPAAGEWALKVTVQGERGRGVARFPVEVEEPGGISPVVAALLAAMAGVAGWSALVWWRGRRGRARPGGGSR